MKRVVILVFFAGCAAACQLVIGLDAGHPRDGGGGGGGVTTTTSTTTLTGGS